MEEPFFFFFWKSPRKVENPISKETLPVSGFWSRTCNPLLQLEKGPNCRILRFFVPLKYSDHKLRQFPKNHFFEVQGTFPETDIPVKTRTCTFCQLIINKLEIMFYSKTIINKIYPNSKCTDTDISRKWRPSTISAGRVCVCIVSCFPAGTPGETRSSLKKREREIRL